MTRSRVGPVLCVLTAVAVLAACGGDDDAGAGASGTEDGTALKDGKRGGTLTFIAAGDVDYLDPGQTYYTFGYTVHYAVNRTLYAFRPNDPVDPVPDLADREPEISPDNRTITVRIKPGIRYAPPVDREVSAADIKYAFERAFSRNVPSGYAGAYFTAIEGAPEAGSGAIKDIPGIETPDDRTIVFRLSEPQAPQISQALAMPITTPVPEEYARPFDAKSPSTYDQYVAFTGLYMVRNDAQGKTVGRDPGKQIEIVRNPNWKRATDFRPAYLDWIVIQEGNDDLAVAARRGLEGESAVCCDSGSPPAQVLPPPTARPCA